MTSDDNRAAGFVDMALEQYGIKEGSTFDVHLPRGDVLKFKALARYGALKEFYRAAGDWYQSLPKPGSELAKIHPFGEHLPRDGREALVAYTISELSVEPKFEQLDALKLLRAPWLVEQIMLGIEQGSRTMYSRSDYDKVEAAKNESGATTGTEHASSSPETSTVATTKS